MAYRFDSVDDQIRFSPGNLVGYTFGASTFAALINRNESGVWNGILTMLDASVSATAVLIDAIEFDNTNHFAFWNGRTGGDDISGATTGTLTDTTNWYVVAVTWGGASTAPRYHWKQLGTGSWTHSSISDATGGNCVASVASADRIIIGTDPTNSDWLGADVVWAGINESNDSDAKIETLDTTSWSTIGSYGFDWYVGFETSSTINDATGGGGNETTRTGITLVADPAGWSWGGTTTPISIGPVALTLAPTVSRVVNRQTSVGLTMAPTVSRVVSKNLSTALTFAASATRQVSRIISTPLTFSVTASKVKSFVMNISAALTLTPSVTRVVNRNVTASLSLAPTVSRVVNRTVSAALTLVPTVIRTIYPINISVPLNFVVTTTLGWAGGVAGGVRRAKTFFFGRRGIY